MTNKCVYSKNDSTKYCQRQRLVPLFTQVPEKQSVNFPKQCAVVYKLKNEKKRTNIPTFKSSPGKLGPGPAVGLPVVVGRANLFEQTVLGSFSLPLITDTTLNWRRVGQTLLTRRTNSLSPCFTTYLILRTQALVASWIAHQTAACPNTWFTGTVLVGNEMNSSEILLLNSFSGVSLLSPDWYCSVLAGYLLSFWARSWHRIR